jgi:hypothetical protein
MFAVTYIAHHSGVKLQLSLRVQFCNAYKDANTSCEAVSIASVLYLFVLACTVCEPRITTTNTIFKF